MTKKVKKKNLITWEQKELLDEIIKGTFHYIERALIEANIYIYDSVIVYSEKYLA